MISAWKRLLSKSPTDGGDANASDHGANNNGIITMPPGVHKLDKELQRKFARGVNYNMKVIIKGDNRVGKTSLFLRLKGYGFQEEYIPTESLNVTSIDWNYKATDNVVKIDLWETVDSASRKSVNFVDLKMENETNGGTTPAGNASNSQLNHSQIYDQIDSSTTKTKVTITSTRLHPNGSAHNNNNNNNLTNPIPDSARQSLAELSENLDVYRGCNAVLLMMDMTKLWTFKYIQNELPKIPKHIPVLVIGNHRDQGHHRAVSSEQVKAFIDAQPREPCDAMVMYTEASMKNGFGIRLIEKFFNIPFLKLQEASLLKQLELNRQDYMTTKEELSLMEESTHREYEQYLEMQTIKRRQLADSMSPVNSGLKQLNENTREQIRSTGISSDMIDKRTSNAKSIESDNSSKASLSQNHQNFVNDRMPSIVIGAKCPLPDVKSIKISSGQSSVTNSNDLTNKSTENETPNIREKDEDDSEEEEEVCANPLVADYQSDIDSDDQLKN
uniref:Rab-like protein 1 n=1 Tax=Aceria tosichella TaxID=561515 RepID=A0A6G1SBK7_9ACAR